MSHAQTSWTDRPILGSDQDRLDFGHYADTLAQVILSDETPITVGIFGPWGSGKSSLMRLLTERLVGQRTTGHRWARPLWFDAWQYARDESTLWRTLLLRVLESLREGGLSEQDAQQVADWETRLYADVRRSEHGSFQVDWPTLGKGVLRLGLSLVPTPQTFTDLWQLLSHSDSNSIGQVFSAFQREQIEVFRRQLTLLEEFKGGFAHLAREYVWQRNGVWVIFVDDLDRCMPQQALEVLETIKIFLDVPGCVFVLALDRDLIECSVKAHYADYVQDEGRLPIYGRSYLEKIVQLPFYLPPLEEDQIARFIGQHNPALDDATREAFALGLEPNPRVVKRTLNIFRLLEGLAERRNRAGTMPPVNPALLAKMVVIQARYPDLYNDLSEYPNLIQDLEQAAREKSASQLPPSLDMPRERAEARTMLQRYALHKPLMRMLRTGPAFGELSQNEVRAYIYLTRTTAPEPGERPIAAETRLWADLLSGDPTRVSAAASEVRSSGQASEFATALARLLQPTANNVSALQRVSAGRSLGLLGDPRSFNTTVTIPAGNFLRGMQKERCYLPAFRIRRHLVTNAQYAEFLAANGQVPAPYIDESWAYPFNWDPVARTFPPGRGNYPVVLITWYEARTYCEWAGGRLCSEEEWEKAARGEDGRTFPWGEAFDAENANVRESGIGGPTPVGVYPHGASPYGLLDCAGNVWEWTASFNEVDGVVLRGGSWNFYAEYARCFASDRSQPGLRSIRIGFRVAHDARAADM